MSTATLENNKASGKMTAAQMSAKLAEAQARISQLESKLATTARPATVSKRQIVERPEWDFNVSIQPVHSIICGEKKNDKIVEGRTILLASDSSADAYAVINNDTKKVIRFSSAKYGLISNVDLIDVVRGALKDTGYDPKGATFSAYMSPDGGVFNAKFQYKEKQTSLTKVGDFMGIEFIVRNSYNGKVKAQILTQAIRLACLNSMCTPGDSYALSRRHQVTKIDEIDEKLVKASIETAAANFSKTLDIFERMADVPLKLEQGSNILARLCDEDFRKTPLVFGKRNARSIRNLWLNPDRRAEDKDNLNLYGLLNAVTEFTTHELEGTRKQYETASRINEYCLFNFSEAAESKDVLKSLLKKSDTDLDILRETSDEEETATA